MVMALPGLLQGRGDQVGFVLFPRSSPGCSGCLKFGVSKDYINFESMQSCLFYKILESKITRFVLLRCTSMPRQPVPKSCSLIKSPEVQSNFSFGDISVLVEFQIMLLIILNDISVMVTFQF